jgi:formylglycine-generating enzyme required for sulfatase activity
LHPFGEVLARLSQLRADPKEEAETRRLAEENARKQREAQEREQRRQAEEAEKLRAAVLAAEEAKRRAEEARLRLEEERQKAEEERKRREAEANARKQHEALCAANVQKWRGTGEADRWVTAKNGKWDHGDWLALVEQLKRGSCWPMGESEIGTEVEAARGRWQARENARLEQERQQKAEEEERKRREAQQEAARRKPKVGEIITNSIGMKFAWIVVDPVEFLMGSPSSESGRDDNEELHRVMLKQPFALGIYPVRMVEFYRFVKTTKYVTEAERINGSYTKVNELWTMDQRINWRTPGFKPTAQHPVVCVSWNDANAMVQWLNEAEKNTGRVYSLPTEAQWEYACRAGSQTAFHWGNDEGRLGDYAWFSGNSRNSVEPVDTKIPNAWGLWHMNGLVWEWCKDRYGKYPTVPAEDPCGPTEGYDRVIRGSSLHYGPQYCRSARRGSNDPSHRSTDYGFRLAVSG